MPRREERKRGGNKGGVEKKRGEGKKSEELFVDSLCQGEEKKLSEKKGGGSRLTEVPRPYRRRGGGGKVTRNLILDKENKLEGKKKEQQEDVGNVLKKVEKERKSRGGCAQYFFSVFISTNGRLWQGGGGNYQRGKKPNGTGFMMGFCLSLFLTSTGRRGNMEGKVGEPKI